MISGKTDSADEEIIDARPAWKKAYENALGFLYVLESVGNIGHLSSM